MPNFPSILFLPKREAFEKAFKKLFRKEHVSYKHMKSKINTL